MNQFRQRGLYIAICTSDDREGTEACIKNWGLHDSIDVSAFVMYAFVFLYYQVPNFLQSSFRSVVMKFQRVNPPLTLYGHFVRELK